jgi:hypothetical protein
MKLLSTLPLSLTLLLGACALPQLDVQPRYEALGIDGEIGVSSTTVTAKADLERMGLDDDGAFGARADFKWGIPHLVVMGQASQHSGSGTLDATLTQGGNTINAGADVDSSLDVGSYSALLLFDVFPGSTFELALGFGAALIDYDLLVEEQLTGTTIDSSETLPLPLVAANAGLELGSFELALLASGLSYDYNGDSGSLFDGDASLRWRFLGGEDHLRGSLVVGWRALLVDLDIEDGGDSVEGNFDLAGPYLGIEVTL